MAAHHNISADQFSLFDASVYDKPAPKMDHDPAAWVGRADITYHASKDQQMPGEINNPGQLGSSFGPGFHHGDLRSAMDRGQIDSPSQISPEHFNNYNSRDFIHPLRQSGVMALRAERSKPSIPQTQDETPGYDNTIIGIRQARERASIRSHPLVHTDIQANANPGQLAVASGQTMPYVNAVENAGSISYRSPRSNLHTWAEDVAADPGASRVHQLQAEQFDLTIPAKQNFKENALSRGLAKNLPTSLSGPVAAQHSLFGDPADIQPIGQSELRVLQPRLKRKDAD